MTTDNGQGAGQGEGQGAAQGTGAGTGAGAGQGAGDGGSSWLTGVDADTAKFITDATIKDLPSLAKTFVEQKRALSQPRPIEVPKPEDAEGWKKLNAALGVPEAADKYDFGDIGKAMQPEEVKYWQGELHKLGISQKSAAGLVAVAAAKGKALQDATDAAFTKTVEEDFGKLKSEWGDNYDANYDLAKRGMKALSEQLGGLTGAQLDGMQKIIGTRAVHMLGLIAGRHMVEQPFTFGGQSRGSITKEQAQKDLNAMAGDKELGPALVDRSHPRHKEAVEKKRALEEIAFKPGA